MTCLYTNEHILGAANELRAAEWFVTRGYQVYFPVIQSGPVDFVVEKARKFQRVQVKTASWNMSGPTRYLQVRTRRGHSKNHSRLQKSEYDLLFVVGGEKMWLIPSDKIDSSNLSLLHSRFKGPPNKWNKYLLEAS